MTYTLKYPLRRSRASNTTKAHITSDPAIGTPPKQAITGPDTSTGWYDSSGFENGDECNFIYGATQGTAGALYNQVINGLHFLTQEEFSNKDFAITVGGCVQAAADEA